MSKNYLSIKISQIQKTLFQQYYSKEGFSKVTSSHWRDFGERTKVTQTRNGFEFNTYGISTHHKKSTLRILKHLPIDFLLSKMLSKNAAEKQTIQGAKLITSHLNIHFDFDHAKHVLIYDLLDSYGLFNTEHLICIIGDGHGFFGTLIRTLCPDARILFINLGRNLLIDAICFSAVFPDIDPLLFEEPEDCQLLDNQSIIFLEAEHFEWMQNLPISLFINVASMGEMDLSIIKRYFKYMRTSTAQPHFYCSNREEKTLPDGAEIRFVDYPWGEADILFDELCPWYQQYPSWRPPFWRPFDGPFRHRLVKLKS